DFQKDGSFDLQRYQQILHDYYAKSAPDYEAELRRQLSARRLLEVVSATADVSEDEVHARFLKDGDTVTLVAVRFLPTMYAEGAKAPSPAEVEAYRASHASQVEAYYRENPTAYRTGEQVHARHILVAVPKDAPAARVQAARDRADALRREILGGKAFADVARASSEDPGSKEHGGDLGWAERSAFVPEFTQAAFGLPPGQVSEPVRSPFGWHLILVEEKRPAVERPLVEVSPEIAALLLKRERSRALASAEAKKALAGLLAGKSLLELYPARKEGEGSFEQAKKPQAVDTGSFSVSRQFIPQLGPAPALLAAAAAAEAPRPLPSVYEAGEGFVVAQVTARERATPAAYAAKREAFRAEALRARQNEVQASYLEALKKLANIVTNQALVGGGAEPG
ncbi:MAG TPA: peptidylprolyl isomerase, partial [Myxococcaceae bacterium]|nr:peptidylprolyl isomerase [Myxococcaceae bacterium]